MLQLGKFYFKANSKNFNDFRHHSFDAVQFLVEKARVEVDPKDRHGRTPLDHAIKSENGEIVQYLKAASLDPAARRVQFAH